MSLLPLDAVARPTSVTVDGVTCGAQPDERGPIGGGEGYRDVIDQGDVRVATVEQLIAALADAKPGTVVLVEPDVEIDITEWVYTDGLVLKVPAGVTLAGGRGAGGSPGGAIVSDALQTNPMIEVAGDDVRITGLRLRGPDPNRRLVFHYRVFFADNAPGHEAYYKLPNSGGIHITDFGRLTVDNCEISAFSHVGVMPSNSKANVFHHNFFHHCQRMGLGYGMTQRGASESLLTHNLFQDNKHDLAGTGEPGQCYDAMHNVVLEPTESHAHPYRDGAYGQDHIFDMHGGRDRQDGTTIAGRRMRVSHNTFFCPYVPVVVRGVPEEGTHVDHNWFPAQTDIQACVVSDGEFKCEQNVIGSDPPRLV